MDKKKFYAYVDESGQDTKGSIFVVSVLVLEQEREDICKSLETLEKESGKKNLKWNKSRPENRKAYIEGLLKISNLKGRIFFDIFSATKEYIELTSLATAKAILKKSEGDRYEVIVFVDGLKKKEIEVFTKGLRDLYIKTKKIRGVKKDENNAYIRLVDAICGLIRDTNENEWAKNISIKLKDKKFVSEL